MKVLLVENHNDTYIQSGIIAGKLKGVIPAVIPVKRK